MANNALRLKQMEGSVTLKSQFPAHLVQELEKKKFRDQGQGETAHCRVLGLSLSTFGSNPCTQGVGEKFGDQGKGETGTGTPRSS